MHYYCFTVEPETTHPVFYEIQAGYAHAIVRDETDDSEQRARIAVELMGMKIQELQTSRVIAVERYGMMPQEAQIALRTKPIYVEVVAYKTGGGPEKPPPISW